LIFDFSNNLTQLADAMRIYASQSTQYICLGLFMGDYAFYNLLFFQINNTIHLLRCKNTKNITPQEIVENYSGNTNVYLSENILSLRQLFKHK